MGDWANWATREKKQMETNEDEIDKKMMTKKKKISTRNNRLIRNIMRTRNNRMRTRQKKKRERREPGVHVVVL